VVSAAAQTGGADVSMRFGPGAAPGSFMVTYFADNVAGTCDSAGFIDTNNIPLQPACGPQRLQVCSAGNNARSVCVLAVSLTPSLKLCLGAWRCVAA
jgi:hypothetical protein